MFVKMNGKKAIQIWVMFLLALLLGGCSPQVQQVSNNSTQYEEITTSASQIEDEDIPIKTIRTYSYNECGSISEICERVGDDSQITTIHKYEYDDDNNLIAHYNRGHLIEENLYENGKLISQKFYEANGMEVESHQFTYSKGVLTSEYSEICVYPEVETQEGEPIEMEYVEYYYKEYNASSQLIKEVCYEYDSEPYIITYSYSHNKVVAKSTTLSGEHFFTETTTYDNAHRIVSIHSTFIDDGSNHETTYSYDDKQITESTYFDGEKQFYFVSKYNSEGYITSYSAFTAENEIMRSAKFEYDDHNNVIKLVRTNSDDEISISYAPDREYDANGRITSETYYSNIDYFSPTTLDIYKTQYL